MVPNAKVTAVALLCACAAPPPPTEEDLTNADCGPRPSADYQDQIRTMMGAALKEPELASYDFGTPEKDWAVALEGGYIFGWKVEFTATFDGYEGEHPYKAFFFRGRLEGILEPYREPFSTTPGWTVVATPAIFVEG